VRAVRPPSPATVAFHDHAGVALTLLPPDVLSVVTIVAFLGGLSVVTIGPGGVFVTVALYTMTSLYHSTVAGTTSAVFAAAGLVGAYLYTRSGEISAAEDRRNALSLGAGSGFGALIGVYVNSIVDAGLFRLVFALVVVGIGLTLLYRERVGLSPLLDPGWSGVRLALVFAAVGFATGIPSGLLGIGGPAFSVPVLVVLGIPLAYSVAVAQVQMVFVAGFATVGYLQYDAVLVPVALVVGVPMIAGMVLGWRARTRVDGATLRLVLAVVLVGIGGYMLA